MDLLSAAQMKETDNLAIHGRGIPSTQLMERAAQGVVRQVLALAGERPGRVIVFSGPGNNGGDGVATARLLRKRGWTVRCILVGKREKMSEDCQEMERRLQEIGGTLESFDDFLAREEEPGSYDVAVDSLFGIGLNSPLRPDAARAAEWINRVGKVVAVDVPSGIQADTGEILGCAVQATTTVTFSRGKPGLYVGDGAVCSGQVVIEDIGIPEDLLQVPCQTFSMEKPTLPRRRRNAHKGDFGRVLIVAGSVGYTGAPILASQGAVGSGTGLVTLAVPKEIYALTAMRCQQAMPIPLPEKEELLARASACDAILVGPGLGLENQAEDQVLSILRQVDKPVIVDADGLTLLARHMDVLEERQAMTVLTPHDGEFARLSGCRLPIRDRLPTAREFAQACGCVLVLKGYRTITAFPDGTCVVNTTGNPGMAKGGAGDVLGGILCGFLAQFRCEESISSGVWIHGRAGDLAAREKGEYGMTIPHLLEQLPYALKECEI